MTPPSASLYDQLGGQAAVQRLVDRFYHHMDTRPDAAAIRALHDDDLTADRHKLAAFLSGWLGGPGLYWERWDHATLHARHRHLPVDDDARGAWLRCMAAALDEVAPPPALRRTLDLKFAAAAAAVRNRPPP